MEDVAKVFVLFLCRVQLVLRSGVLTVLDLDKVDVTPSFAEAFRSVLSDFGGSTGGWWCCWDAPSLPKLPPATPKNPLPTFFVFVSLQREQEANGTCLEMNNLLGNCFVASSGHAYNNIDNGPCMGHGSFLLGPGMAWDSNKLGSPED